MNSQNLLNLEPNAPQMSVIRIEEININNPQIVPIHIINNDIGSEILIPHMYLTKPPPVLIDPEKPTININNIQRPTINVMPTTNTQFNSITTQIIPTPPINYQKRIIYKKNPAIPESSTQAIINEQIELYPLNSEQYLKKDGYLDNHSMKTKSNLQYNDPHSSNTSSSVNEGSSCHIVSNIKLQNSNETPVKENNEEKILATRNTMLKRKVQNYIHISDTKVPQRAIAVLPTALVLRGKNNIFARRTLPSRIRFGPVEGIHTVISQSKAEELVTKTNAPVFLIKKDDQIIHIDVSDKDKCNWMGLLPLASASAANLWLYQEECSLFAMSTAGVPARAPLALGYSRQYAEQRGMAGVPTLDLETVLASNPKQWWCNECNRALPSAPLLQRHADVYHKDDVISTRRGYRCIHCRRVFSRLYTLRRHTAKYCTKKLEKTAETTSKELNTSINDETRLPSDESFQNFTNGLDFTASLFDTDRISNIDISGNSRADDFNPYDISFRDDTCTSNDLSFTKLAMEMKNEALPDTRVSSRASRKQNKRKYICDSSKKFDCACGRSFRNSEKLSQHYLKEHGEDSAKSKSTSSPEKKVYTCDQCKTKRVSFKRRGMLVNHLWRAHKVVSNLKVERPVRHYPCVACAKLYRSAAKRDRHIAIHHPGSEKLIKSTISGGVKSCEAAVCAHCPRQYATRAKLLQHMRMAHSNTTT